MCVGGSELFASVSNAIEYQYLYASSFDERSCKIQGQNHLHETYNVGLQNAVATQPFFGRCKLQSQKRIAPCNCKHELHIAITELTCKIRLQRGLHGEVANYNCINATT